MTPKKAAKPSAPDASTRSFAKVRDFDGWLRENHASSTGLWMKIAKKGAGFSTITYAEALDIALAWGWIDAQKKGLDATAWLQRFTPRGPRSIWSKVNRAKALELIASGKMRPSGLEAVARAKENGRWDAAYDSPGNATVPPDLEAAFAKNARAAKFFETLDKQNRYAVLHRIQIAKKPETRARRIAKFVAMLAKHEKLHP